MIQTPMRARSGPRPRPAPRLYDASLLLGLSLAAVAAALFLAAVIWALVAMFG